MFLRECLYQKSLFNCKLFDFVYKVQELISKMRLKVFIESPSVIFGEFHSVIISSKI